MFAVVLVLDDGLDLFEAVFKSAAVTFAIAVCAVCVATPFKIGLAQIGFVGPEAFINHRL